MENISIKMKSTHTKGNGLMINLMAKEFKLLNLDPIIRDSSKVGRKTV